MKWLNVARKLQELLSLLAAVAEWFAKRPDVEPPEQLRSLLQAADDLRPACNEKLFSDPVDDDDDENFRR